MYWLTIIVDGYTDKNILLSYNAYSPNFLTMQKILQNSNILTMHKILQLSTSAIFII